MKITKDPKIISQIVKDPGNEKVTGFRVGPSFDEIEGIVTYDGMINAIEKGQVYQVQAKASSDPSNVIVKDLDDGTKILTTGKDGSNLNNLDDLEVYYQGQDKGK